MDASVLTDPKAMRDTKIGAEDRRQLSIIAAVLIIALLSILVALLQIGIRWNPVNAEQGDNLLVIFGPIVLVLAAWASHRACETFGRFQVLIAATIVVAIVPHPLLRALSAVSETSMPSFVMLAMSVMTGALLGAAIADICTAVANTQIKVSDFLSVVALGAVVPGVLLCWSPDVWWQATVWYTTFLSIATAIAAMSEDASGDPREP